jgi:hypothetical protein
LEPPDAKKMRKLISTFDKSFELNPDQPALRRALEALKVKK